jgi:hypothetical protein
MEGIQIFKVYLKYFGFSSFVKKMVRLKVKIIIDILNITV